jgi:hypothetical protein
VPHALFLADPLPILWGWRYADGSSNARPDYTDFAAASPEWLPVKKNRLLARIYVNSQPKKPPRTNFLSENPVLFVCLSKALRKVSS